MTGTAQRGGHAYLDGSRFHAFAHRGGAGEQPENTARAFEAAVDLGYRYIETDVQATSDGVVVVFHDDTLNPLTDGEGVVSDLPYHAVREAKVAGREPIMTLEEMLNRFPDTRFNIDIKTDHTLRPAIDLVRRMDCLDRVCLASFSDIRLDHVRDAFGADVCTSSGPRDVRALKYGSWGLPVRRVRANCAQVPVRASPITIVTPRFLRHCHSLGVAVHVWTIDVEEEMRRLIRMGVDGIMSDRPTLLKQVAQEEGVW